MSTYRALLLIVSFLTVPLAARADDAVTCDSREGDRDAPPGHYEGEGSFALEGQGDYGDVVMRDFNLRMTMTLSVDIAPPPREGSSGEATGPVTVAIAGAGTGVSPVATGYTSRRESRTGTLAGYLSKGVIVHVSGSDLELALRVERVTCGNIYGATDMTQGSIAEVAAARRAGGITDALRSGSWRLQLVGRDEALEARVAAAVRRLDGADATATAALSLGREMLAFARELGASPEPFARCLSAEVMDAVAQLAGRRADASITALTRRANPAALAGMLRRAMQDARAASSLGCELSDAAMEALGAAEVAIAGAEAAGGARARDLMGRLRRAELTGSERDMSSFMSDMNAAATAAGRAAPFPPTATTPGVGGAGSR